MANEDLIRYGSDKIRILLILSSFKKSTGVDYLTFGTKTAFNYLRHTFIQALILQYFDLKCHIRIEIDVLGYIISGVLNPVTFDDLSQWNLIVYYLNKMILAKT